MVLNVLYLSNLKNNIMTHLHEQDLEKLEEAKAIIKTLVTFGFDTICSLKSTIDFEIEHLKRQ